MNNGGNMVGGPGGQMMMPPNAVLQQQTQQQAQQQAAALYHYQQHMHAQQMSPYPKPQAQIMGGGGVQEGGLCSLVRLGFVWLAEILYKATISDTNAYICV